MFTEPNDHHRWLQRFLGEWTFESSCDAGPDTEPMTSKGRETITAYSDLWIVADAEGDLPGGAGSMTWRLTLGFNPATDRYTGSWIGSPVAHMFVYDGAREGDAIVLDTKGPDMADPTKLADYQDIYELLADDKRALRSRMKGDDGNWIEFMRAEYTRV